MTAECDKLGVNNGTHDKNAGLWQFPGARYHGGCPLAEIWVTGLKSSPGTSDDQDAATQEQGRRLEDVLEANGGTLQEGDTWSHTHVTYPADISYDGGYDAYLPGGRSQFLDGRRLAEGSDVPVATAETMYRATKSFRFTNGERPFYQNAGNPSQPNYNRQFAEAYSGIMAIAVEGTVGGIPLCWCVPMNGMAC